MTNQFLLTAPTPNHHWGIVLAGGEGSRIQHFLKEEFGLERPKQYCAILGNRSMLRHTIERAETVIPKARLLTVINKEHLPFAEHDLEDRAPDTVFMQPLNRETAPGILLPLLHVHHRDPDAVVALFPSDHFIVEEERFMDHVRSAFAFVAKLPDYIVTLGVTPNSLQSGYGWMEKGDLLSKEGDSSLYSINVFWEKPGKELTEHLYARGCLWNTLTLVGGVKQFIDLFREYTPDIFEKFGAIEDAIGTPNEDEVAADVFSKIPVVNFSDSILERIPHRLAVVPVKGVYWSDWGDESRIREDIASSERYLRTLQERSRLVVAQRSRPALELITPPRLHDETQHESQQVPMSNVPA